MSRSSAEAEYRAMTHTACDIVWLKNLLIELEFRQSGLKPMHSDNQSAIYIAQNPVFRERTKHIEINYHFLEMLGQKRWLRSNSHRFQSSWLISLPKLPHLRCFLIYVTSWTC